MRDLVLCGTSAMEYWRAARCDRAYSELVLPEGRNFGRGQQTLEVASEFGLTLPLHTLVDRREGRGFSQITTCHVAQKGLRAQKAYVGDGLYVTSPADTLLQLAGQLSPAMVWVAALELLGTYACLPASSNGFVDHLRPLLTPHELMDHAWVWERHHLRGCRALACVADGAAAGSGSPMESRLYTYLSAPRRLGGYAIPGIQLNHYVELSDAAGELLGVPGIRPDLWLESGHSALEYDSRRFHPLERSDDDQLRTDVLETMGYYAVNLTPRKVSDFAYLDLIVREVAERAGLRRLYPNEERQRALHTELFLERSQHFVL